MPCEGPEQQRQSPGAGCRQTVFIWGQTPCPAPRRTAFRAAKRLEFSVVRFSAGFPAFHHARRIQVLLNVLSRRGRDRREFRSGKWFGATNGAPKAIRFFEAILPEE